MARLALGLALACAAPATPAAANAKELAGLVLVGARGDAVTLRPPSETIDRLWNGLASTRCFRPGAAVEPAFERFRLARAAARPARCIPLVAAWRAPATRLRPARFCLCRQGIHARGRLSPLGSAVWAISGVQLQ